MKKLIVVVFIAVSFSLSFSVCASELNNKNNTVVVNSTDTLKEILVGKWKQEKIIAYDKNGELLEEFPVKINDCTIDNHTLFLKDGKMTAVENVYHHYTDTCKEVVNSFNWTIENNILKVTQISGKNVEAKIVKLDNEVLELEKDENFETREGIQNLRFIIIHKRIN